MGNCNYWTSDIKLKFIGPAVGYMFEMYTDGKSAKSHICCAYSSHVHNEPSMYAKKLL